MTVTSRAGSLALIALVAIAAARGDDTPLSIHAAVASAVADGHVIKTKQFGPGFDRDPYSETNSRGGVLIGFELGLRDWFGSEIPTAVRPIYRTSGGESNGKSHGNFALTRDAIKRVVKMKARTGYAVGAIRMRAGGGLDAMQLTYYRISGDRLDPSRSYKSEWVGNLKGGSETGYDGAGQPFVGVYGSKSGDRVTSLGLMRATLPDPAPRKTEKPAVKQKPAEKPKQSEKQAEKQPVAAKGDKTPYRDAARGFKAEVPAGWVRMLAVDQQEILRTRPGLFEPPDAAFRDDKAALGDAFVLLRSRGWRGDATLDEAGAELTPTEGPYREVRGLMRDWVRDVLPGEVVVDRSRARFAWRTADGDGKRGTLFVCYVGSESVVTVECHASQANFATALPAFAQVNESAGFDAAHAHREPSRASTWLPIAVFLGVSAVIFVPMAFYFGNKRRNAARAAPKSGKKRRRGKDGIPYAEVVEERPEDLPRATLADDEPQAFAPTAGIITAVPPATPPKPAKPAAPARHDEPADDPFTCVGDRTYRIYVLPDEVYFIDEGPGDVQPSNKFGKPPRLPEERRDALDMRLPLGTRPSPDDLFAMADGETNFRVKGDDVWTAQIDAPGFWDALGDGVVGTLRIGHRTRGDLVLRFRGTTDMRRAIEQLPRAWGHNVTINATWDKAKKKFVREG